MTRVFFVRLLRLCFVHCSTGGFSPLCPPSSFPPSHSVSFYLSSSLRYPDSLSFPLSLWGVSPRQSNLRLPHGRLPYMASLFRDAVTAHGGFIVLPSPSYICISWILCHSRARQTPTFTICASRHLASYSREATYIVWSFRQIIFAATNLFRGIEDCWCDSIVKAT